MLTPDCQHCPVHSHFPGCDFQCLLTSERFLNAHCSGGVAAIVVEPILSSGGMIFPPAGYFKVLRQLADRLGALLISDEAQTGMGRTGRWFGIEHDDVVPDILVFSKGAGGGFPVAGVVVSDDLANSVIGRFSNFSSHQSDPLAAAALSAVIDIIEEEGLIGRAQRSGSRLADGLGVIAEKHEILSNVRGRGLMIGIDVNSVPARGWSREQTGRVFEYHCRAAGVHVKSIFNGATFRILPPLTISNTEIDRVLEVFEEVSRRMRSGDNLAPPKGSRNPFTKKLEEARAETLTLKKALSKAWEMSPARWYERLQRTLQR
jgi:2,2-dialkylglycine decarboxylase (pyruvate)